MGFVEPLRQILNAFLSYISATFALDCLTGRGNREGESIVLLPSNMTKVVHYEDYVDLFCTLRQADATFITRSILDAPLTVSEFNKYCNKKQILLKASRTRSDFCDYCAKTRNDLHNLPRNDDRYGALSKLLSKHCHNDTKEHQYYCNFIYSTEKVLDGLHQYVMFDYAEKVLLPRLVKQLGQLYFVTGLKFELFGVHDSNAKRSLVF